MNSYAYMQNRLKYKIVNRILVDFETNDTKLT